MSTATLAKAAPPETRANPSSASRRAVNDSGRGPSDFDPGGGDFGRWNPMGWNTPASASRAGIYVALASVSMLFLSLASIFSWRKRAGGNWMEMPLPRVLYLNTLVLLASSGSLQVARRALNRDHAGAFRLWLYITLGLGLAFLAGQWTAWRRLLAAGFYLTGNPSSALFYVVTGAHALHLAGGLVALFYLALRAREIRWGLRRPTSVEVVSIYWHFMDGLWISLLVLLLVLR
jgi:cytochrome c oxidase subunit III